MHVTQVSCAPGKKTRPLYVPLDGIPREGGDEAAGRYSIATHPTTLKHVDPGWRWVARALETPVDPIEGLLRETARECTLITRGLARAIHTTLAGPGG